MTLQHAILLENLAFASALFEPLRDPFASHWGPTWVLRKRFPARGLPYRAARDSTEKQRERALAEAMKAGWVTRRRAAMRTVAIKLTPSGLAEGWRLLGVEADTAIVIAAEVARLGPKGAWVPETKFNGGRGWGDGRESELKAVQVFHSPALVAGLIESHCNTVRQVYYRTTPAGLKAVAAAGELEANEDPPEPDPEATAVFAHAYAECLVWLDAQTPATIGARGELGAIPLPACT